MSPLDLTQPVQWDGRPAEVLCTDLSGDYPIAAKVTDCDGRISVETFTINGCLVVGGPLRLTNAPKREVWWLLLSGWGDVVGKFPRPYVRVEDYAGQIKVTLEDGKLVDAQVVE